MIFLLTVLRIIGAIVRAVLVAIAAVIVVCIVITALFLPKPPSIPMEITAMSVIAIFAVILLVGIDRTRHKITLSWAQHYLQSQPPFVL